MPELVQSHLMNLDTSHLRPKIYRSLSLVSWLVPYAAMFILVLLLWLPFGFKATGLGEEWTINSLLDNGQQLFFNTPISSMTISRGRPLQLFFFALAHALDPNSFTYYNIFMMLFFFGKIAITYLLMIEFLPEHKLLAFLTGVLFVLYPADSGLFALNALNIHCTVLTYLIATYFLVQFGKQNSRLDWWRLAGAAFFLLVSLWQYPGPTAMAVVTPFFLLYFTGLKRRFWIGTGVWYVVMAIGLFYSVWAIRQPVTNNSYDQYLLQQVSFSLAELKNILQAFLTAYVRQVTSWTKPLGNLDYLQFYGIFAISGLVLTALVCYGLERQQLRRNRLYLLSMRHYIILWCAGFILFGIGIATYMTVPALRFSDFRIFNIAAIGSAIVLVLSLHFISMLFHKYRQIIFVGLALPFVALALVNAFQQHQQFVNYSLEQQNILQQIVEQAPQLADNTAIVLIDRTGVLDRERLFTFGSRLQSALNVLYSNANIEAYYCPLEGSTILGTNCQFDKIGVNAVVRQYVSDSPTPTLILPYDRLLLFATEYDGTVKLLTTEEVETTYKATNYDPKSRIIGNILPQRVSTLFSCIPALSCYRSAPVITNGTFDLRLADEFGLGWRASEVDSTFGSFRWSVNRIATVDISLTSTVDLDLEFKVLHWLDEDVINSLKLSVNGMAIPLTFTSPDPSSRMYHAIIPRNVLNPQSSNLRLMFTIDHVTHVTENQVLGFALNGLRIRPA